MGRALSAVALLLGLGGAGALIVTARTPARGPDRAAIDAVAQELDARWREAAASASSRAQTLADLPRLQVAVATDEETVRDLTGEELAFRLQPDETIEISQLPIGEDVDARADVYAVGAICYELLIGEEINLDLARLAHLGRQGWPHLPPPSQERAGLPPELDALVFRAMAFDRADRFASCEELEQALADVVSRHDLHASDKVIARWIAEELSAPAPAATSTAAPTVAEGNP